MADPFAGLNPIFGSRLQQMIAAAKAEGVTIGIGSSVRSPEEQAKLRIKNGCPDVYRSPASACRIPTAIPGSSNHEDHGHGGMAVDLTGDTAWANANAARFGLHFPVKGEAWHVEPIEDGETSEAFAGSMVRGAVGTDQSWMDEARTPEDEMHNRLNQIMGVIGARPSAETAVQGEQPTPTPVADEGQPQDAMPTGFGASMGGTPITEPGLGAIPQPGYEPPGRGVERWRPVVIQALQYTGQPTDPATVNLALRRMAQESGGNPRAVNNWDSNAKKGDPTTGLMQNIPSAFNSRARELASRGINDGFANIVASIRYTIPTYGSLQAGWGRTNSSGKMIGY